MKANKQYMYALVAGIFLGTFSAAAAEPLPTYTAYAAVAHIGQRAVVVGKVERVSPGKDGDILLDVDGVYPYQKLVVVITPAAGIDVATASTYLGKTLGFEGKIKCRASGAISIVVRIASKANVIDTP